MTDEEILGTTTVSSRWRISLIKAVRNEFAEDGVEFDTGDTLVFKRRDDDIVIESA